MKKNLKRNLNIALIFTFILSTFFLTNLKCCAANNVVPQQAGTSSLSGNQVPQPAVGSQPASIPQKNAYALTHLNKQDDFKVNALKFLLAMLGVLVSALTLFLVLKLYKKVTLKNNLNLGDIDYDKTLESPKDFKEAINIFLDKTDKG